jgi:hypothetical protein
MNTSLFLEIEKAIGKAIDKGAEKGMWEELIHPKLINQMAKAAELVFDSSMDGQEFEKKERV